MPVRWIVIFHVRQLNILINIFWLSLMRSIFFLAIFVRRKNARTNYKHSFLTEKEMIIRMKKKCCLRFSFINLNYSLQPMYLIGEEMQSEICKCILLMFGSCIKCTLIASSSYIDHYMITTRISYKKTISITKRKCSRGFCLKSQ